MKIHNTSFKVSASLIILATLTIICVFLLIVIFRSTDLESKWMSVLGSLAGGIAVAIIQFIIAWQDFRETEKLKNLELVNIMYNRDQRAWYGSFISKASKKIDVMGVTAYRFFDHFVSTDNNAPQEAKEIISALNRGVVVRVLLPASEYLPTEEKKQDAARVKEKYQAIKKEFNNFELKYFRHAAAHSIFRVDGECIVGPVFPEIESKYTPALHLKNKSPLASKYIEYFASEWNKANDE